MRYAMWCCAGGYAATQRRRWCNAPLSLRSTSAEVTNVNEGVGRRCRGMKVKKYLTIRAMQRKPKGPVQACAGCPERLRRNRIQGPGCRGCPRRLPMKRMKRWRRRRSSRSSPSAEVMNLVLRCLCAAVTMAWKQKSNKDSDCLQKMPRLKFPQMMRSGG